MCIRVAIDAARPVAYDRSCLDQYGTKGLIAARGRLAPHAGGFCDEVLACSLRASATAVGSMTPAASGQASAALPANGMNSRRRI